MPAVADGDCAVSVADQLGFRDYHSIWDYAANSALKGKRPNPNQLLLADNITIPTDKTKIVNKAVDSAWTFIVKTKQLPKLRVVLVDNEDKPLSGKSWNLTAPKNASGKTKKNGLIEVAELDAQAKAGTLTVEWQKSKPAPKKTPPKDPVITKPVYPRAIKASDFTDAAPPAPDPSDDTMEWTLKIGSLPTFDDVSGVCARLYNLGFRCEPDTKANLTGDCVKVYQRTRLKEKTPSGAFADIESGLRDFHDNP
jgi:hypothetical protein